MATKWRWAWGLQLAYQSTQRILPLSKPRTPGTIGTHTLCCTEHWMTGNKQALLLLQSWPVLPCPHQTQWGRTDQKHAVHSGSCKRRLAASMCLQAAVWDPNRRKGSKLQPRRLPGHSLQKRPLSVRGGAVCQEDKNGSKIAALARMIFGTDWRAVRRWNSTYHHAYIYIYINMVVDQSFFRKRPFFGNKNVTFAKLSQTPRLSLAGPMLGNNASYEDSFITCQTTLTTPENHGSLLDSLVNMQLAASITESILRTDCCWLGFFLPGLLDHPLQHALWLSPAPSQNFRGTFATISLFTHPGQQLGAHWRKSDTGALVFGSRKGSLLETWLLHLVWLSRSLTFGSSAAIYEGQGDCPKAPRHREESNQNYPVPFSCRTPGGRGW